MKQNNYMELSGSSFVNTSKEKPENGVKHEIQIFGNPRNTKKQKVLVGNLDF